MFKRDIIAFEKMQSIGQAG